MSDEKAPPCVTIIKTTEGVGVTHNLVDPWLAIALLEMGKATLMNSMKPRIQKPGMAGLLRKMSP